MTHGLLNSVTRPNCAQPNVPRRRPATAIGAARFYSSSSPNAADDSASLASLNDDEKVLERLSGVIGSTELDRQATKAAADDENLLRASYSLENEDTLVMP